MSNEIVEVKGVKISDLEEATTAGNLDYLIINQDGETKKIQRGKVKAQKISELTDDVGYLTQIPSEYMTESEVKEFTNAEITQIREVLNTWTSFKNTGGTIRGDVDFSTGLNARRVSLKNDQNDFFSFITLNDTTIGIKFNDSILQTLDRFGEFYIGGYSKEPNGYTKLPNGFIIQWGHTYLSNDLGTGLICTSLSFPIQFPRDICHVYLTPCVNQYAIDVEYGSSWERPPVVYNITPSDFGFAFNRIQGHYGSEISWFAIGY